MYCLRTLEMFSGMIMTAKITQLPNDNRSKTVPKSIKAVKDIVKVTNELRLYAINQHSAIAVISQRQ